MKFTAIFILIASLTVSARSFSQNVTLAEKNAKLEKVFKSIKDQTGYVFFYDQSLVKQAKPVTINVENTPLETALNICFKDQPLSYSIVGSTVVIKKKEDRNQDDVTAFAPPIDIHGRIVNENGDPVLATVTVKGTGKGVNTNDNGEFELKGISDDAILIITGVNIESFEVKVGGRTELVLNATTKVSVEQEVKIVNKGYYTTTQKLNTGNVGKVTSVEIQKQPVSNVMQALEGRLSGVYISQGSGLPGSFMNIKIRGQNSIRFEGNNPLIVVDGVTYPSTNFSSNFVIPGGGVPISQFSGIDPSEIESVEILKDADATAIYGSRGANGVVLITTKRGKPESIKVDVNLNSGVGKATRLMKLLDTKEYLQMRHEAFLNDNATPQSSDYDINGTWDSTRYTDWQKVLLGGTAHFTNLHTSISGGNANTQFLIGGGYLKETAIFPGAFSDQKSSLHFNIQSQSPNKKFKISLSGSYLAGTNTLPQVGLLPYVALPPDAPKIYDSVGNLNWENSTWNNPLSYLLMKHKSTTNNLVSNLDVSYEIAKNLVLKISNGFNSVNFNEVVLTPLSSLRPSYRPSYQNSTTFSTNAIKTWIAEPQANYLRTFGENKFEFLLGATFQKTIQDNLAQTGSGFITEALMENLYAASSIVINGYSNSEYKYNALFGRIGYSYQDKYLINLTARRDGSSRFGPGKQFGNFGAIGLGWIFTDETFIKKSLPFLSFGKLRASYGVTGNDQIGDYGFLNTYSSGVSYIGFPTLSPTSLYNPDEGWESNRKFEAGVSVGSFNDKILLDVNFYKHRSSNQLVQQSLPGITGFTNILYFNSPAVVENRGWEFQLTTRIVNSRNFLWMSSLNATIPKNELISYPNFALSPFANQYEIGKSLYLLRRYHYTGVDQTTGNYTFLDVNSDNRISYPQDIVSTKERTQKFYGGWQNNFQYKGFEIGILLQYVNQYGEDYHSVYTMPGLMGNQPAYVLSRWQKPGDQTNIQKFSQNFGSTFTAFDLGVQSDNANSDASFFRVKNIYLSYQFSKKLLQKASIKNLRIYLAAQNAFTVTKYKGFDPETFNQVPPLKMLSAGINLTF